MRVTNGVMMDNYMKDLSRNMNLLDKYNQQLSSGKKFRNPSQNPIGVTISIGMNNVLTANEQYIRNVGQAREWLSNTESVLDNQGAILQRVKEQVTYAANGTLSNEDREAIADEIAQLRDEMINLGNSKIGDRYLFAGQTTKVANAEPAPFEGFDAGGAIIFNGDNKLLEREIGAGIKMAINTDGEQNFKDTIDTLTAIEQSIRNNSGANVGNVSISDISNGLGAIEDVINTNLRERAKLGARINRLDLTENRLNDEQIQAKELLSNNEDVDIAEAITQLKMQESIYQSSLSVGARILQPSLIDFMR